MKRRTFLAALCGAPVLAQATPVPVPDFRNAPVELEPINLRIENGTRLTPSEMNRIATRIQAEIFRNLRQNKDGLRNAAREVLG